MLHAVASWILLYGGLFAVLGFVHRTQASRDRLTVPAFAALVAVTAALPVLPYLTYRGREGGVGESALGLFPLLYLFVGVGIGVLGGICYLVAVRDASAQLPDSPLE